MTNSIGQVALIVGAGAGLGAALARAFARAGLKVAIAARDTSHLDAIARTTGATAFACDAARPEDVALLFKRVSDTVGEPDVVVFNAGYRARGAIAELDPAEVAKALAVGAFGGFLVAQEAARRMLVHGRGAIIFTGATASLKGYAGSAPFAMSKFALRGLAQSLARELAPRGIHVAHVIVDGAIRGARRTEPADQPDSTLDPDSIAENYIYLLRQPRNAWTWEIELRPWIEKF